MLYSVRVKLRRLHSFHWAVVVIIATWRLQQIDYPTHETAARSLIPVLWTCAIVALVFTRRRRALNVGIGCGRGNVFGAVTRLRKKIKRMVCFVTVVLRL